MLQFRDVLNADEDAVLCASSLLLNMTSFHAADDYDSADDDDASACSTENVTYCLQR